MYKQLLLTSLFAAVLVQSPLAQQQVNLAGTWTLVDSDPVVTWQIDQSPTAIARRVLVREQQRRETAWTLNGGETTSEYPALRNAPVKSSARVERDQVVFRGTVTLVSGEIATFTERWQTADGGLTLRVITTIASVGSSHQREQLFRKGN